MTKLDQNIHPSVFNDEKALEWHCLASPWTTLKIHESLTSPKLDQRSPFIFIPYLNFLLLGG